MPSPMARLDGIIILYEVRNSISKWAQLFYIQTIVKCHGCNVLHISSHTYILYQIKIPMVRSTKKIMTEEGRRSGSTPRPPSG